MPGKVYMSRATYKQLKVNSVFAIVLRRTTRVLPSFDSIYHLIDPNSVNHPLIKKK